MKTTIFICVCYGNNMGFLKTLFTGKRDELSDEEMEKFKQFHQDDSSSYQLDENESYSNLDESSSRRNVLSLEELQEQISLLNKNELVKIKNKIAQLEEDKTTTNNDFSKSNNVSYENNVGLSGVEQLQTTEPIEKNETFQGDGKKIHFDEEITTKINDGDEYLNLDDDTQISEDLKREFYDETLSTEKEDDFNESTYEELSLNDSGLNSQENSNIQNNFDESDDVEVSINQKDKEKGSNEENDPALFSVVHDELMELFESGSIVLTKKNFIFPSIGEKKTLAFGIYNTQIPSTKDQTHWFIQNLKKFSRLKECKMLLSQEDEKDLILEVKESHAIMLSFKTSNNVGEEFIFNTKWD